jgi:Basic region leucine zipper
VKAYISARDHRKIKDTLAENFGMNSNGAPDAENLLASIGVLLYTDQSHLQQLSSNQADLLGLILLACGSDTTRAIRYADLNRNYTGNQFLNDEDNSLENFATALQSLIALNIVSLCGNVVTLITMSPALSSSPVEAKQEQPAKRGTKRPPSIFDSGSELSAEEKKKQIRREGNRNSAKLSRNKKKQVMLGYIEENTTLRKRVNELESELATLRAEVDNFSLPGFVPGNSMWRLNFFSQPGVQAVVDGDKIKNKVAIPSKREYKG